MPLRVVFTSAEMKRLQTITDLIDKARLEMTSLYRETRADKTPELGDLIRDTRALLERFDEMAHSGGPDCREPRQDPWREGMVECVRCNRYDYPGEPFFENIDFDFEPEDEEDEIIFCEECWAKD